MTHNPGPRPVRVHRRLAVLLGIACSLVSALSSRAQGAGDPSRPSPTQGAPAIYVPSRPRVPPSPTTAMVRVCYFDSTINRSPLRDSGMFPGGSTSTLGAALSDPANFGPGGRVDCSFQYQDPGFGQLNPGDCVNNCDVFFAGLDTTPVSATTAAELQACALAGAVVYVSGDTGGGGEGLSYNPFLLGTCGMSFGPVDPPSGGFLTSVPIDHTGLLFDGGPFGPISALTHTPWRELAPGSGISRDYGQAVLDPNQLLLAECGGTCAGAGPVLVSSDPIYFNIMTDLDTDNVNLFLNLFARACTCAQPTLAVHFGSFAAAWTEGGTRPAVAVVWSTLSEDDTNLFVVERAEREFGPYTPVLDPVTAAGSSSSYRLLDTTTPAGTAPWYRIVEYTSDGPGDRTAAFETTVGGHSSGTAHGARRR